MHFDDLPWPKAALSANRIGQELARRLRVALRELELAAEEIDALKGQVAGRVAVASLPLLRTLILPRAINSLLRQHPEAKVEVIDGPYETVLNDLRHGTVDFLLGASTSRSIGVTTRAIGSRGLYRRRS